jgi:hypothetical protein
VCVCMCVVQGSGRERLKYCGLSVQPLRGPCTSEGSEPEGSECERECVGVGVGDKCGVTKESNSFHSRGGGVRGS